MSRSPMPTMESSPSSRKLTFGFNEETLAGFGLAVLLLGAVLWASFGPLVEKTDFSLTYVGAWIVHQGRGPELYNLSEQVIARDALFKHPNPLFYEHPPFEALLSSPLAGLPYRTAYLIWGLVNAFVWFVLPYLIRPYAPVPRETLGYFALWIFFAPLGVALYQGQSSLLLLLLYTLSFISLKRRREWKAGMYIGFGLFKFQFVLPFALIFLLRKKWRFLTGFAFSATLLGALSLIAVGWQGVLSYIHLLLSIAGHPSNASYGNSVGMATVQGFVHSILGNRFSPIAVALAVGGISLALVLVVAWRWSREDCQNPNGSLDIMFAVSIVVALVDGFHMFTHDLSPFILALFLVAAHFPGRERPALRVILATCMTIFWIPPILFGLLDLHGFYLLFPPLLIFAFAALRLVESPFHGVPTEGKARA